MQKWMKKLKNLSNNLMSKNKKVHFTICEPFIAKNNSVK